VFAILGSRFSLAESGSKQFMGIEEIQICNLEQMAARDFTVNFLSKGIEHEAMYYGKPLEIRGTVNDMYRREKILGFNDMRAIQVKGYKENDPMWGFTHLELLFPSERLTEFANLKKGDRIVFRGVYLGQYHHPFDTFDVLAFVNPVIVSHNKLDIDTESIIEKAEQEYLKKNYLTAKEIAKSVIDEDPENADAWCVLGACEDGLKNYELALRYFEKACNLEPEEPIHFYNRGRVYITVGQREKAKEILSLMEKGFPFDQSTRRFREAYDNNWKY
jgi:tetratricopeptide (TPR) repeat protein